VSEYSFDSVILIDSLNGVEAARAELRKAGRPWISRVSWIEVMSKMRGTTIRNVEIFLGGFSIDEVDMEVSRRAAALRRERPKLRLPDAVIFASAQVHGRILVTRNVKDFPLRCPASGFPTSFEGLKSCAALSGSWARAR
jgi:predicted nucleic acid-binding protein